MLKNRIERLERKRDLLAKLAAKKAREARSPEEKALAAFMDALACDDDFLRELQRELAAIEEALPVDLNRAVDLEISGRPFHFDTAGDAVKCWGKRAVLTEEERAALDLQFQEAVDRVVRARWEAARGAQNGPK